MFGGDKKTAEILTKPPCLLHRGPVPHHIFKQKLKSQLDPLAGTTRLGNLRQAMHETAQAGGLLEAYQHLKYGGNLSIRTDLQMSEVLEIAQGEHFGLVRGVGVAGEHVDEYVIVFGPASGIM